MLQRSTHRVFVQRLCKQGITKYGFAVVCHLLLLFHPGIEQSNTYYSLTLLPDLKVWDNGIRTLLHCVNNITKAQVLRVNVVLK